MREWKEMVKYYVVKKTGSHHQFINETETAVVCSSLRYQIAFFSLLSLVVTGIEDCGWGSLDHTWWAGLTGGGGGQKIPTTGGHLPADETFTQCWFDVGPRLRRWPNNKTTLGQRLKFPGGNACVRMPILIQAGSIIRERHPPNSIYAGPLLDKWWQTLAQHWANYGTTYFWGELREVQ